MTLSPSVNLGNMEASTLPQMYPSQATISMEIRHQGNSDLEMAVRYHQDGPSVHPAYRQRAQSTGSVCPPGFNPNQNNQSPVYCAQNYSPKVLPGFHGSPAFRSGSFLEPQMGQNFLNPQSKAEFVNQELKPINYMPSQDLQILGRPRTHAVGHQRRPNLNHPNRSYSNHQTPNVQNADRFNYHFEGFQEGYNPNFVEYHNTQNYSPQKDLQYIDMNHISRNGNVEDKLKSLKMAQENGTQIQIVQDTMQMGPSILDCNIADVIKTELEIDGTLDFI